LFRIGVKSRDRRRQECGTPLHSEAGVPRTPIMDVDPGGGHVFPFGNDFRLCTIRLGHAHFIKTISLVPIF
jgi:hypothetical protein